MAGGDFKAQKVAFTAEQRKRLAEMIKTFRKEKGYTSAEVFSNVKNIPRAQMGRYENGHNITFDNLIWLIHQLDLTPKEFFDRWFEW